MGDVAAIRNGIDVDRLVGTIGAIQSDPALASFTFKATTTWLDGTHNTGNILGFTHAGEPDTGRTGSFVLEGDEPPVLLGNNAGPNAVEHLLQALGFCYSVATRQTRLPRALKSARWNSRWRATWTPVRSWAWTVRGRDSPRYAQQPGSPARMRPRSSCRRCAVTSRTLRPSATAWPIRSRCTPRSKSPDGRPGHGYGNG